MGVIQSTLLSPVNCEQCCRLWIGCTPITHCCPLIVKKSLLTCLVLLAVARSAAEHNNHQLFIFHLNLVVLHECQCYCIIRNSSCACNNWIGDLSHKINPRTMNHFCWNHGMASICGVILNFFGKKWFTNWLGWKWWGKCKPEKYMRWRSEI